ncbi:hypothetical protein SAMN02745753_04443 [Marinomonas polaris DSM 16579]|uniref:N-acetyltransferase domain-containing protein n=1 Tax=Marinomonas polaris DSM 16579 TaxID=1122206 RepID=A0A1M5MDF6_9GAMM|nr:GNAT family N-acetyltransferase [Marinomonas polaris]SHG75277.1 hypothetical protein SAMN02745753_04443 [Marinomonas polaris DSM 16579]
MLVNKVDALNREELLEIVKIHKVYYPSGHMTKLFSDELLFSYYQLISDCAQDILIVKDNGGSIIGFAFLGNSFGAVMKNLILRNKIRMAFFCAKNFKYVISFFLDRFGCGSRGFNSSSDVRLISIVVNTDFRKGIGFNILEFIKTQLYPNLIVGLSVKTSNIHAVNFYIRNGFFVEKIIRDKIFMVSR